MPNYAEGVIRIRGTYENLKQFIDESFDNVYLIKETTMVKNTRGKSVGCDYVFFQNMNKPKDTIGEYMKIDPTGSGVEIFDGRYYAVFNDRKFAPSNIDSQKFCVYFKLNVAWCVENKLIINIAKKYNLDIALESYEYWGGVFTKVKIVNGKIVENVFVNKFDDDFDFPNPLLGF